jgi:hypothetical protein
MLGSAHCALAGVLPEDRADVLYHRYDGGDVTVDGPSILLRKKIGEQVSVSGNYSVDMVTSASIDVKFLSGASEYKEERKQGSVAVDYLRGKSTYNVSFINSDESDYEANTASVGVSEDMFGDLTTVSLGFTRAWDKVFRNVRLTDGRRVNQADFGGDRPFRATDHRSYRVGISQILTKNLIVGLNYEGQSHEGYLANPYRAIRTLNIAGSAVQTDDEVYPRTRTTSAVAIDGRYYLPYRAAVRGSYRFFSDTWGINAQTAELGYTHPWRHWIFEGSYRYHKQDAADFFLDLFPRPNAQNFMARDRNLATMKNQTAHLGVTYEFERLPVEWLGKASLNLFVDYIQFDFEDFRDIRDSNPLFTSNPVPEGMESLYSEDATVVRFFVSVYF